MYLFGETWCKLLPNPVESIAHTIVKPLTKSTWKNTNLSSLATSGIYSQSEHYQLQDPIMFPAEKKLMMLNSSGAPAESDQLLLTASAPLKSREASKSSTYNANNNSGKDQNSTNTTLYPHSELKVELSRTHVTLFKSNMLRISHVPFTTLLNKFIQ